MKTLIYICIFLLWCCADAAPRYLPAIAQEKKHARTRPFTILSHRPTGLEGEAVSGQVNLTWVPVDAPNLAATPYTIYRSLTQIGGYSSVGTSAGASFVDSTVTNGTTYYYRVSVKDDAGRESPSTPAEVVVPGISITTFQMNAGATVTNSTTVTLNNTVNGTATDYRAGEQMDLSGETWFTWAAAPNYTFNTSTEETKTVYLQVRDATSESPVAADTILYEDPTPPANPGQITNNETPTLNRFETTGDYFISTTGSPGAAGTFADPYDLLSVWDGTTVIPAGSTVLIRGGTYIAPRGGVNGDEGFIFDISDGTSGNRIVYRPYNDEHVLIDGGIYFSGEPKYFDLIGVEVYVQEYVDQNPDRYTPITGSGSPWSDGSMNVISGRSVRIINNIVRDCPGGIGFWKHVDGDSEVYGNIVYDNGWYSDDRYHGPGVYGQNPTDATTQSYKKYLIDNIVIDNYSLPMQIWGSSTAYQENFEIRGNFVRHRSGSGRHYCIFGGYSENLNWPIWVDDNVAYDTQIRVGTDYSDPPKGGTVFIRNNTVIDLQLTIGPFANPTISGNVIDPVDTTVWLRENKYEIGRANIAIYQPGTPASTVNVDFDTVLANGDNFEIVNYNDIYGTAVQTGTYTTGSPVAVQTGAVEWKVLVIRKEP